MFKQKTAYEMCISDWSSDVCSSDLGFLVRPFMHSAWVNDDEAAGSLPLARKLAGSRTGRTLFFREDGSLKRIGDVFLNPDYAATLRRIATAGWTDFYRGDRKSTRLNSSH